MDQTPNLSLPYIMAAQAQKHVTHNEALRALDAIVQLSAKDRDLTAPPVSPADGDRYIVAVAATGVWAGKDNQIAAWQDNAWIFHAPVEGWLCWVADEDRLLSWDGSGWIEVSADTSEIQNANHVGVNATADDTNRLAISSPTTLFNHEGNGHQLKVNKNGIADTASLLFQTSFSGRAEFGTTGDDDWHVKVSPDGTNWSEALVADKDDGSVTFPSGTRHALSGAPTNMLIQTPGGTGVSTIWRFDVARDGIPRYAAVSSVSGDILTLTTAVADQFFTNASMENVSYVRIWNTTKSPEEAAWIRKRGSTSEIYVTDSADIAGWSNSDILRFGEPIGGLGGLVASPNAVAVDISPFMQNHPSLGTVFRQGGLLVSMTASASGSGGWLGQIAATVDASSGSFVSAYTPNDGALTQGFSLVGTNVLSPISNSNLILIRELENNTQAMRVGAVTINGVYV